MRKFGLFLVSATFLCFMSATWIHGQGGEKKKTTGGFGNFGFGGQQTAVNLFSREDVKKELDITQEQVDMLPSEVLAAVGRVLNEKQFKRFKQLDMQKKGNDAFKDKTVQKQLKMTDEQIKSVTTALEESAKALGEIKGGGFGGGGGGTAAKEAQEKRDAIRKETKEKIQTALTKDQRASYRDLVGDEFKFQQPNFGGFNPKGKDNPKKKDAE